MAPVNTPAGWASHINRLLDAALGQNDPKRFPIDIGFLAEHIPTQFNTNEPIVLQAAPLGQGFDACLNPYVPERDTRRHWALIYNQDITSSGRIRFTQSHELGHYLLHRAQGSAFMCSEADMLNWDHAHKQQENEADQFASYLLMPRNHFERQMGTGPVDLDVLGHCAEFFGVSLMATTLKWLQFTYRRALVVCSREGSIQWAWGSDKGKFLSAKLNKRLQNNQRGRLPEQSATMLLRGALPERQGIDIKASVWFADEPASMPLREMTINSDQYKFTMSLLVLPDEVKPWERDAQDRHHPQASTWEGDGLEDTLSRFERRG